MAAQLTRCQLGLQQELPAFHAVTPGHLFARQLQLGLHLRDNQMLEAAQH